MAAQGQLGNLGDRPLSVEEITKRADGFFDPNYPMRNWFRTATLMQKQANVYEHEGNEQMAYFLLYRYATLFLTHISKHPHAKDPKYKQLLLDAQKTLPNALAKLEDLKPRIKEKHDKYMEKQKRRAAQAEADRSELRKREYSTEDVAQVERRKRWEHERKQAARRIDATENRDMAVQLANLETQRRVGHNTERTGKSNQEGDISADLINVRRQMDRPQYNAPRPAKPRESLPSRSSSYQYPSVPFASKDPPRQVPLHHPQPQPIPVSNGLHSYESPPIRPAKEGHYDNIPPPLPDKPFVSQSTQSTYLRRSTPPPPLPAKAALTTPSPSISPSPPSTTRSSPTPNTFAATSHLESGEPLRTIFLPSPLRHQFLRLAARNTSLNLETCGMLVGSLIRNALFITKLVIPAQTSTSDTCEMVDEAAFHSYIDGQPDGDSLLVLGWIHTHPTQTCFMSSRDLHTHVWYQVSLAESIAIVCAPSKAAPDDWGVFRLTDPPGVGAVKTCKRSGIFHPHEEGGVYTDCVGRPGHVIEHEGLQFDVVDLR